ncbi:MAG: SRPBCC family protein [Actinomycetota bacterium]|nr:SRPBCC family protein [Actinomycetota bacterium]
MSDHQHSADIDAPADKLFDYLSEIRNLPAYFSAMTSVEAADGDAVRVVANVNGIERAKAKHGST